MDLISALPDNWKHDIELITETGRDDRGDITPGKRTRYSGCLLAINDVSDLDNLNSQPSLKARVFIPKAIQVSSTDQIVTFAPAPVQGRWAVEGPAIQWPLGTEVRLEWEGSDV